MEKSFILNLFISYSHKDDLYLEEFIKHIEQLISNELIEIWYDKKVIGGEEYQDKINYNIENADVICLLVSKDYLYSSSCKVELKKALALKVQKGISVVPIILKHCGWLDNNDLSKLLAFPDDGNPISGFADQDVGWQQVYRGLKKVIEKDLAVMNMRLKDGFADFLQNVDMLTEAHSIKSKVYLEDIFIHHDLEKYNASREHVDTISSCQLITDLLEHKKIVIAGEDQSGKTALCKLVFSELRNRRLIPVYISDKQNQFKGLIDNKIKDSLIEQYEVNNNIFNEHFEKIIPIVDDFHFAKYKEKHISNLMKYSYCIITVDDIFSLNVKDDQLIRDFNYLKIGELRPSQRYELIKKWVGLSDDGTSENDLYFETDKQTELVNNVLGKIFGKRIMPSYPFFILTALVSYSSYFVSLDQEISSQAYCYQALIFFYLRKQGVKSNDIDIYLNFLTEIAFYFYDNKKYKITDEDFNLFMENYLKKFNLPIKQEALLVNVRQIFSKDSLSNFSFRYPYLYYYFVAKHLTENYNKKAIRQSISNIIENLHLNENAYIAIFMVHHSTNIEILEEIEVNASLIFEEYNPPATLMKDEVDFFDKQSEIIIKAALPPSGTTPEANRSKALEAQDAIEKAQESIDQDEHNDFPLGKELRRAIKTVEVIGCILKNRSGSLEKKKLEEIFKEAMYIHLRILNAFFEIVNNESNQKEIISYLSERLEPILREEDYELDEDKQEVIVRKIFWNLSFFVIYGNIKKIIDSLGSEKMTKIVISVCDEVNTPASYLVKYGILMGCNKNLVIDDVAATLKEDSFSRIGENIMKLLIVEHCALHQIKHKELKLIEEKIGIPTKKLLTEKLSK